MALPHQAPSRLGQVNAAGDNRELFLKLYAGEVLTAFEARNIFMPLHRTRTISNGKSATFPMVGTTTAKYHTPGSMIEADTIKHGERVVTVDDLLISTQFISNIDEAMNHWDVRSVYSKEAGNALANQMDRNIARIIAKASSITTKALATSAGLTGVIDDETYTTNVTIGTTAADALDGTKIAAAIYAALAEFDKKDVTGDKICVLPPDQYYSLFNVGAGVNTLAYMNTDVGGSGSLSQGVAPVIGGVKIVMSNHIPQADMGDATKWAAATGDQTPITSSRTGAYYSNYSKVRGLIFSEDSAATVKLLDLGVESEYQIERQGTLMVAKYACGHNILKPACAISLNKV
jgi:hypothetical protein